MPDLSTTYKELSLKKPFVVSSFGLTNPIDKMLDYLKSFMVKWNFKQISDFRGRFSYSKLPNPSMYERAQFMKYFPGQNN